MKEHMLWFKFYLWFEFFKPGLSFQTVLKFLNQFLYQLSEKGPFPFWGVVEK